MQSPVTFIYTNAEKAIREISPFTTAGNIQHTTHTHTHTHTHTPGKKLTKVRDLYKKMMFLFIYFVCISVCAGICNMVYIDTKRQHVGVVCLLPTCESSCNELR